MNRIAVVGTGYVGLTTGAYLAHLGHTVVCADVVPEKVERLSRGEIPIVEAGLEELVREGIEGGRLSFVLGAVTAVAEAEFVFLCLPTPQGADGAADMSFIKAAAEEIGPHLEAEAVVINKSTVPVGSTRVVQQALGRSDVFVVSNPEFLREGSAVHDCLHPDRIVIGADDQAAAGRVAALFEEIQAPLIVTDSASAEMIKYASNAFLATKVSFINAIANVCEAVGADVREVAMGMGYDKRIGFEFLKPGPGWGGSCFLGDETVLTRVEDDIRLRCLSDLWRDYDGAPVTGLEVLAWREGESAPEFLPVTVLTRRAYEGEVVTLRTKMGRRITVTADHPVVVCDGVEPGSASVVPARLVAADHWLPIAQRFPMVVEPDTVHADVLGAAAAAGITSEQVIVRLSARQLAQVEARAAGLPRARRRDVLRCGAARLSELEALDVDTTEGQCGTTTNGTYVPALIDATEVDFWRMVGLFLAEGHISTDGSRERIVWSFNHTGEEDLVAFVAGYWASKGVKTTVRSTPTSRTVTISSRLLAAALEALGAGRSCYDKGLPDLVWSMGPEHQRALLRGLWDGDGSWSLVNGGPSVVLEYGTVSRRLADGLVRLLGAHGIVARLKIGRTPKSTADTFWIAVAGADQVENACFLLPEDEQLDVLRAIDRQSKRTAPTGYRRLSKNAAWVRVAATTRQQFRGDVYSLEVPPAHTVVSSFGLVLHNCFPKDSRALVRIAEESGYDFGLLRGVVQVNDEQYERVAQKIAAAAGGSLDGATIGIWGLAFKARTDDRRDSPSIEVIKRIQARGAKVRAYDPTVPAGTTAPDLDGVEVVADAYAASEGATVLALLTEWDEFRWLDFDKVAGLMKTAHVVDARNLLDPAALRRRGFTYEGIGR